MKTTAAELEVALALYPTVKDGRFLRLVPDTYVRTGRSFEDVILASEIPANLDKWRRMDLWGVDVCREYIQLNTKCLKHPSMNRTSYGWKHVVERWAYGYISNGDFIMAAAIEGVLMKVAINGVNMHCAVSEKRVTLPCSTPGNHLYGRTREEEA